MSSGAAPSGDEPTVRGLTAGQRHFGRFELVRALGRGGMGIVWLARDEALGEEVALKFLPDLVRWDPAALAELRAETRRARQLTHPHIVRIHDLFEDATGAAIAMEFIDGRTLTEERLARPAQVLEPAEIAPWLPQLAAALDYAHQDARVVHRDLKPSNLMLTRDGRIKVTDFGVARALGETMLRVSQLATGGTLLYMSPQQALGEMPSARDDLYALGATLYELLTGKPPFHTGNIGSQIERRRPDSVAERRKQLGIASATPVPRAWEEAIAACLAKQPEDRPASAGEVAARLTGVASGRSAPRAVAHAGPRWFTRRTGLLAVLAATLGLMAWTFRTETQSVAAVMIGRPTTPATAFPSDETRAYAAWNFDGDGRESSGRGWDLSLANAVPTPDRFGRIDGALQLNGGSAVQRELPEAVGWRASEPFSVTLWVRPDHLVGLERGAGTVLGLRDDRQGDLYWHWFFSSGGMTFAIARAEVDGPDEIFSPQPPPAKRWSHLAVVSDGQTVRLHLNGREVAHGALTRNRDAVFSAPPRLVVGFTHKFDLERFAGAVDELRLWRRALRADEVAALAAPEPPPRFVLTQGAYAATDDLAAAVSREFGPSAGLADWQEIKRWHADDTEAWCEALALSRQSSGPLVQKDGRRHSASTRHYFVSHFDGRKPDYFLAHEELGGMRLALGSWHGITARLLVRLPFVAPLEEELRANGAGDVVRELPAAPGARAVAALAVRWRQEVKAGGPAARLEITLRDGRQILAVCEPTPAGGFALALGAADRPEIARQAAGKFVPLQFSVVLREGRLFFRAVSLVGAGLAFHEAAAADFPAQEVARVTVRGVDSATLVREE